MQKGLVILCAIGWVWTGIVFLYLGLRWRGRFSGHGTVGEDEHGR
jgi:hypothetical protein